MKLQLIWLMHVTHKYGNTHARTHTNIAIQLMRKNCFPKWGMGNGSWVMAVSNAWTPLVSTTWQVFPQRLYFFQGWGVLARPGRTFVTGGPTSLG